MSSEKTVKHKKKIRLFKVFAMLMPFVAIAIVELIGHVIYYKTHKNVFLWETATHGESGFLRMDRFGLLWYKPNSRIRLFFFDHPSVGDLEVDNFGLVHNGRNNREKSESAVNIIIVGGSTVEGRGSSSNKKTIPALVETRLRKLVNKEIDVYNFGFSGDVTFNEDMRIKVRAMDFNPDIIISLNGLNDYYRSYFGTRDENTTNHVKGNKSDFLHGHVGETKLNVLYNAGETPGTAAAMVHGWLLTRSMIYKLMHKTFEQTEEPLNQNGPATPIHEAQQNYFANLNSTAAFLRSLEVHHAVFFQPTLGYKKTKTESETAYINKYQKEVGEQSNYFDILSDYYKKMEMKTGGDYLNYYNISGHFNTQDETLYTDSVHYNDKGNQLIANEICRILLAQHRDWFGE